ncbi:pyrroloquinoline quinone-dependent dehydrogenase [Pseudohongiella sp.]|uniref:pyrroloquinoline quinone-dependent dehydrogenase n=1 Tax=Pseudohongiella sp. TaxID=1979412 RepID=UPI0017C06831|nr:pyrroloquinoline quinone-dependent dehydrogenase [Pseudohongiella sp.]HEA61676.1 pyrroloquinoline quinone-dependent dehydrogenase [Pseudohongiella sp.]
MPCRNSWLPGLCTLTFSVVAVVGASAQDAPLRQQDWRFYGSDAASSKYVPLAGINADNVSELEVAWVWDTPDNAIFRQDDRASAGEYKSTPIMVDGVLYVSTSLGQVAAIDAATGAQRWVFDTGSWQRGRHPNFNNNHRGVSWWDDGGDGRIFMAANDGLLWSLNARTGQPDQSFGDEGIIDLKQGLGRDTRIGLYGSISPPLIINGMVVVGSSISDGPLFQDQLPPGHVRGFDARTGEQRWIFHTIPQAGEPGVETWENEAWRTAGATNVWTTMSADPDTGYVYLPTSTPNNDWYGGHRLGDNLHAESLVALDSASGEMVWHFQVVRHGLWDYDLPAAPNLVDITVAGRDIKAVAQVTKQGFVFVLDRLTGEPVWPIEDRPVPQSTVPGERSSPTQPFPTRPAPFEPQGISDATLIDFTPALRAQALDLIADVDYGPLYTPPSERGVIIFPGYSGGATWTGAATDPETGIMYIPSFSVPRFVRLRKPEPGESDFGYIRDRSFSIEGPQGLPLIKPPYARITAIDLNTGEHRWMVPHGEGIRQRIIDLGIDDPGPVGSFGRHGPLLTRSLLFVAQLDGSRPVLRSYDKTSGEVLSELDLPLPPMGTPMSYMVDGKQYIVMAVGAGPVTRLMAGSLP